ncbi:cob(II)yrinic acid a,c-diamide reductase domain protein [Brucella lupini]|uniref:Cob(II)yrinic acid a,c-diamide reductase domain protein n=1 Tax=Brucella lupini TaxID=255457 RepID=A0A256GVP6_9HYPH|nr:cob(II)yrinic acid a,c-diamide reductase domain protein [Brucella lupini]
MQSIDDSAVYGSIAEVTDIAPPFQQFEESVAFGGRKLHRLPNLLVGLTGLKLDPVGTTIQKQKSPLARAF